MATLKGTFKTFTCTSQCWLEEIKKVVRTRQNWQKNICLKVSTSAWGDFGGRYWNIFAYCLFNIGFRRRFEAKGRSRTGGGSTRQLCCPSKIYAKPSFTKYIMTPSDWIQYINKINIQHRLRIQNLCRTLLHQIYNETIWLNSLYQQKKYST